jgi:glyoxylase-like metal-dependent hydrolase (beta-lactamase superfamily II)
VLETHIHADHLSRSKQLAAAYGLLPSIPANDKMAFSFNPVFDGDTFSLGEVEVEAISTPGHTLESTCYLVDNKSLLTGDTLFIKGVGRPDLKANQHEATEKAGLLYHSLEKLMELDNLVVVLPGHTSKPVAFDHKVIQASLGKIFSEIPMSLGKEGFVRSILERKPATPDNYLTILEKNITGDITDINPIDLEAGANRCAIV